MKLVFVTMASMASMASVAFVLTAGSMAMADTGDSADRNGILAVAGEGHGAVGATNESNYGGQSASTATYCADRPERCAYGATTAVAPRVRLTLAPSASACSTAGDETARPVYRLVRGHLKLAGYECVQDNRGGNGG